MKKILVQIHDLKDPVNYSLELLKRIESMLGNIEVIFLMPKRVHRVLSNITTITMPFEYQVFFCDELISSESSIKGVNIEDCKLQQKVLEKLGISSTLDSLMCRYKGYAEIYKEIIDIHRPILCLCWNGQVHIDQTVFRNIVKERGIPTLFLERGLIPQSVFFDFDGVNAVSSIVNWTLSDYKDESYLLLFDVIQKYIEKQGVAIVKLDQKIGSFIDPYILFPLQRDSDSNLVLSSPSFKSMYSILLELNNIDLPIDIHYRVHPEDPVGHYTKHLHFDNPRLINQSDRDLESHIHNSEAIMTVNSTIGFSSLLKDKKVITIGSSVYSNKGFTLDYKNFLSMSELIDAVLGYNIDSNHRKTRDMYITKIIMNHHMVFPDTNLRGLQIQRFELLLKKMIGDV